MTRHLVWDWNGTLFDDLAAVVAATNDALVHAGGNPVTADEHRERFRRPIADYYGDELGRPVLPEEFALLDRVFHDSYETHRLACKPAVDAFDAIAAWRGSQSLLSMWHHTNLVPLVEAFGLTPLLARVDGLRGAGGGPKLPHLVAHLEAQGIDAADVVLIGDSVDDADAALSVGAKAILYTGGFTAERKLRAVGVPVAASLLEAVDLAGRG
ncbi:phosphatase [Actinorhabdospora filicis]|uniref:Phosphatase n=1 Tax=Actinorhabdospora filicis TaxID=1785913 RepID=A0A9W6SK36_9ACTN|nr:HAD hydrolase-like protein [Actinorhabdospora filicis]GLZ77443.1 phosphatase [Actinorhabdospora filicis]